MPQYEVTFTASVSDSIVIDFDGDAEDIDEMVIRQHWDGLPLMHNVTYDWDGFDIFVQDLKDSE